jgi:hypothetical protein
MTTINESLVLVTFDGVFVSQGPGSAWYALKDGLVDKRVRTIVIDGDVTFIGTQGRSVWKRPTADLFTHGVSVSVPGNVVPTPVIEGKCFRITLTNPAPGVEVKWYRDGQPLAGEHGSTLEVKGAGSYTVTFENSCDVTVSNVIDIGRYDWSSVDIYNVVTNNNDGRNDRYFVADELIGSRLTILNRWGETVFSSPSYQNDWVPDGLSDGQYFYLIDSPCYGSYRGILTLLDAQ